MKTINVLFVCLGNICRSPTAEGVFTALAQKAGLADVIQVDSAGTAGWHIGKSPDTRTVAAAKSRQYDLSTLRARQVSSDDFDKFDYVLAMDHENLSVLKGLQPNHYAGEVGLFLHYSDFDEEEVPDPYYGGAQGFEHVLDLVENASQGLLAQIKHKHSL